VLRLEGRGAEGQRRAVVAVLDEDEHRAEGRRVLPHQPRRVDVERDVVLVAAVEEDGSAGRPVVRVHEDALLEGGVRREVEVVQVLGDAV
jgi:hypothetical protein